MNWDKELAGFINLLLEITVLIFLVLKRKNLDSCINIFVYSMSIIIITEFIARFYSNVLIKNNQMIYSIGINIIVFLLFLIYFYKILERRSLKKMQSVIIGLFILNVIISLIFNKKFFIEFPVITYFVDVVLLLFSIALFLFQTFNSDRILNLKSYYPFWISISLIIIYAGILPLIVVSTKANELMDRNVFFILLFFINLIGYSTMLIGIFFSSKSTQKI